MRYFSTLIAALAAKKALSATTSTPIPPSLDPWYSAPPGFEAALPGQVLRIREAPGNLTTLYSDASNAYNILFRTTNGHYQPAWAVTTLFIPSASNASALLSYQIPYNSADLDTSPSYALYGPIDSAPALGSPGYDIRHLLARGWHVNVPDSEGPLASFGLTVTEGFATLDSIRASLPFAKANSLSNEDPPIALWGFSNGALASEFATELQVQYAPEIKIAGAALGGIPCNLSYTAENLLSGTMAAGIFPGAFIGFTSQYPAAREYLLSQLHPSGPYNASTFLSAKNQSIYQTLTSFAGQDVFKYFKSGKAFLRNPLISHILNTNTIAGYHGTPQVPLYIYKAVHDEIGPINETDDLVERYCGVGVNILYEKNTIGGHFDEANNGDAGAIAWLASVLGGTYNHTGCTTRYVAINITDEGG